MSRFSFLLLLLLPLSACYQQQPPPKRYMANGALLATRFSTMEELQKVVTIEYKKSGTPTVYLSHKSNNHQVNSVLESGISEKDLKAVRKGGLSGKIWLLFNSPYAVIHRNDLLRVYNLLRRTDSVFGEGDIAFFDFATTMLRHISDHDKAQIDAKALTEKGYINTFNHVTSQALTTSIFSEKLADFIADIHERASMPELITGVFSEKQMKDLEKGPIDNYVDIINNEWGQEMGKELRQKYRIDRHTLWTPELLAHYMNDLQLYFAQVFQIGFVPFRPSDEIIQKFTHKLNRIIEDPSGLQ
ncbi:MAG: hypothetical protein AAGG75_03265 [Bacteroidota bacterium]